MSEKKEGIANLSRRQFLKDAGLVVGGTAVSSVFLLSACGKEIEVTKTVTTTAPGSTITSTATSTTTAPGATVTSTAPGTTTTIAKYHCPFCTPGAYAFDTVEDLKSHIEIKHYKELITPSKGHIVVDSSICGGCHTCATVCSLIKEGEINWQLSRIQVARDELAGYICEPLPCNQCDGPECVMACLVGALAIDETTGARVIDEQKCIGCKLCIEACIATPKRIRFNEKTFKAFKCDLCGGDPQCVKYCPTGAIKYVEED